MNESNYEHYVQLGKSLLSEVHNKQFKICEYAMKVCTIRHGGRSDGYYTIKDYANDIGMTPKTLQNWLVVYRNVVLKLNDDQKSEMNWNKASKVNNVLDENRTIDNAINKDVGKKTRFKNGVKKEVVQKLYDKYSEQKPFEGEFVNMVQQMKSFKNILQKRDLNIIQDAHMIVLMELFDCCSDLINDHLTSKRKSA
jgi:hypothetical protein